MASNSKVVSLVAWRAACARAGTPCGMSADAVADAEAVAEQIAKRWPAATSADLESWLNAAFAARQAAEDRGGPRRRWPSMDEIAQAATPDKEAAESLDDAPPAPLPCGRAGCRGDCAACRSACVDDCRRGVIEWLDELRCVRVTACHCSAGRWVRQRPGLMVGKASVAECSARGWTRKNAAGLIVTQAQVDWIEERRLQGYTLKESFDELARAAGRA